MFNPMYSTPEEVLTPVYTAESGLKYPEKLPKEQVEPVKLDLTNTAVEVYYEDVDSLDPEQFVMVRRQGFGGSDSGIILGVNPYESLNALIQQKASNIVTEEEKAVSKETAVIKGNDLEPLIIQKFKQHFGMDTLKPTDMYVFKDFPYLKMNFDGVTGTPEQYIPVEIKVVTKRGEHNYNATRAIFIEDQGFFQLPRNISGENISIKEKAEFYGIPAYYYTQIQQEMMALNAPFGYLCTLWEHSWKLHCFFIYRDVSVQNQLVVKAAKAWDKVELLKQTGGNVYDFY